MSNQQILVKAFKIVMENTSLWVVGIFLSSGFNLHFWYGFSWLKNYIGAFDRWIDLSTGWGLWGIAAVVFLLGLIIVNLAKLHFLQQVHNCLHEPGKNKCFLCRRQPDNQSRNNIRPALLVNVVLLSIFTIILSLLIVKGANYYLAQLTNINLPLLILPVILLFLLAGVSLWNLFAVLAMLWFRLSLWHAARLSIGILLARFKRIFLLTLLTTVIFLLAVSFGVMVAGQIPNLLGIDGQVLFSSGIYHAWRIILSGGSILLVVMWLVLCNLWFNTVMVILFDDLLHVNDFLEARIGDYWFDTRLLSGHHSR